MPTAKKLPSGSWRVRVFTHTDISGKKIYASLTRPSKKEAELAGLELQLNKSSHIKPSEHTLHECISAYIELKKHILSPSTVRSYLSIQRNYFQSLMPCKLHKINQHMVQQAVNLDSMRVSPKTIRNAHGLVTTVFSEYYPNFTFNTKLPNKVKYIPTIPSESNIRKIIDISKGSNIEIPVLLGLWLGLRMSEIKGLTFNDIDGNFIHIRHARVYVEGGYVEKDTKTYSSTRTLVLPNYIFELINALNYTSKSDYIISDSGQAIYKRFVKICKDHDLPHYRFHDLRHANASVMLALGIPDKYAMERMGHSTNNMLKTVYQHTMVDEKAKTNSLVDNFFENIL